ncbi:MAG: AAA family ATPase [Candidatus Paceibacterota bacterium]
MFFHGSQLALESISDPSVRSALRSAMQQGSEPIQPNDLAAAALLEAEPPVWQLLAQAVQEPATANDIFMQALQHLSAVQSSSGDTRTSDSFSPTALNVLQAFEVMERTYGKIEKSVGLEGFILCSLEQLDSVEREGWQSFKIATAIELLKSHLTGGANLEPKGKTKNSVSIPGALSSAEDLTEAVKTLSDDRPSPFDAEESYDQLFDSLARALYRTDGHVLLTGERGVGQSALLVEFAKRAAQNRLTTLNEKRVLLLDYRQTPPEQGRERLLSLLGAIAGRKDLIVCVDGFASLLRSDRGTTNKGYLLALLPRIQGKLIGLLSPREYDELIADDADFREHFLQAEIPEPEGDTAIRLVRCYAAALEEGYLVQIEPEAVRQAVALTADYILHERLPGKAVKVLRDVCEQVAYERAQYGRERYVVTSDDVLRAVSRSSGVPEETLRGVAEKGDYENSLAEEIVGQHHAVRQVANELGLIKAGLTDPGKPASVMLFVGQTGTGKTEMAKTLARFYSRSKRLRTYTLGNFVEPHSVAGIIGVPPGYVGHEQGGRIVSDLASDPYCVFLLDEADKAHPDVLQPFLNLFDEGWVCDQRGVKAYADKSIFILTTNVGQRMLGDMARQGKTPEEMASRMKEALAQIRHSKSNRPVFAPEFLARIKRIVVFQSLGKEAMHGICLKLVRQMQASWQDKRRKSLIVPSELLEQIAAESDRRNETSQGREGGRLVRKLIAEWIETPIRKAASAQPQAYRDCEAVVLAANLPESDVETQPDPEITVFFRDAEVAEREETEHVASAK